MASKKKQLAFRPGTSKACETQLHEFAGRCGAERPEKSSVERIATAGIDEGLAYLRRWRPDFQATSVQRVGLITLLSGSPLD